jgi:hypothetical protein
VTIHKNLFSNHDFSEPEWEFVILAPAPGCGILISAPAPQHCLISKTTKCNAILPWRIGVNIVTVIVESEGRQMKYSQIKC